MNLCYVIKPKEKATQQGLAIVSLFVYYDYKVPFLKITWVNQAGLCELSLTFISLQQVQTASHSHLSFFIVSDFIGN